jgi:queuine tRNA-ribosyltransferase
MERTHRWLERCFTRFSETEPKYGYNQELFPILQGGGFSDLRKQSAEYISSIDAAGYAIGGLSVGEPIEEMYKTSELVCGILPKDKPRYLMGVGTPSNILENIALGVDMFDCVMPTRNARTGTLFTWNGIINIKNKKWEHDFSPLDPAGSAEVDKMYSKSYVRHLIRADELLAMYITSVHNLAFYIDLVKEARKHIKAGDFVEWKNKMVKQVSQKI